MDVRILKEEELVNASGLARYVFDACLRDRMEYPQTTAYVESYLNVENLRRLYQEQKLTVWGVFEQEQMVAVSGLQADGMITMLYVLPQFSGKGIGKKLLFLMREYAKQVYAFERVVLNANPAFTAFYFQNQGFLYVDTKQDFRAPFVPMYAMSNRITNQKKKPSSKMMVFAGIFLAVLAGCIYLLTHIL